VATEDSEPDATDDGPVRLIAREVPMSTLVIRKAAGKAKRVAAILRQVPWVVTDGGTTIATVEIPATNRFEIDIDGRRFTAEMPDLHKSPEKELTVTDATGQHVVHGALASVPGPEVREKWDLRFATGAELTWMYRVDPTELGFYDMAGRSMMAIGHHVPFEPSPEHGTLRILLHLWGAAAKAAEQYEARFDERTIGSVVPTPELPLLAMLGMWLVRRWDIKERSKHDLPT
jgi:hypothetical protein